MNKKISPSRIVKQLSVFAVSLLLTSAFAATVSVGAATCDSNDTVVINCSNSENGIWSMLLIAMNVLSAGVGVLAIAGIVYAAILWTSAQEKSEQINKAKGIITNVVVGIIAFAVMFAGLQYLIPGGVFNREMAAASVTNSTAERFGPAGLKNDTSSPAGTGSGGGGDDAESSERDTDLTPDDIKLVKNLRDASATNNLIKPGVLYRSAQLSRLNAQNAQKLGELLGNGATIIDLRSNASRSQDPDTPVPGTKKLNIPIEGILNTTPMVTDSTRRAQLAKALKAAANADGAVLIHCVAGKDRTGWAIAMIMYVLGANDSQVMREYLKSNEDIPGGVKSEWLNDGVSAARAKHGTIINYLKSIGLTQADLNKIRSKFGA